MPCRTLSDVKAWSGFTKGQSREAAISGTQVAKEMSKRQSQRDVPLVRAALGYEHRTHRAAYALEIEAAISTPRCRMLSANAVLRLRCACMRSDAHADSFLPIALRHASKHGRMVW